MFRRRRRSEEDFREEIRAHLELESDELKEEGVAPRDASYAARRSFGNVTSIEEAFYERSRVLWWDHLRQDLGYALRTLRLAPGFTAAAVATLALGIGANTAIFSVFRAVLLKPLPYADSGRIAVIEPFWKNRGRTSQNVSAPDFHDWRAQSRVFEFMAYYAGGETTAIVNGQPTFTRAQIVTPEFFPVFGNPIAAGRAWREDEDRQPLAVIGHGFALEHFGDTQRALGASIRVEGMQVTIVGVASPFFRYPGDSAVWIPAGLFPENTHRSAHNYRAIGKLKKAAGLEQAREEMRTIGDRLESRYPENQYKTAAVAPLHEVLSRGSGSTLWTLMAAVFGVLLIACANVANLQLARAAARVREMAVRAAIGAGRGRLIRQLLTESLVLAVCGAAAGAGLAAILLRSLIAIAPNDIPRLHEARLDAPVFLFALALAGLSSIAFGLIPALRLARADAASDCAAAAAEDRSAGAEGACGPHSLRRKLLSPSCCWLERDSCCGPSTRSAAWISASRRSAFCWSAHR